MSEEDIPVRRIALAGVGLATAVGLGVFATFAWLATAGVPPGGALPHRLHADTPEPRLHSAPRAQRREHAAHERAEQDRLAWVDRQAGIVRVPLDVAIEMMLGAAREDRR